MRVYASREGAAAVSRRCRSTQVGSNPFGARDTKIANGGVVALTLERGTVQGPDGSSVVQYRVAPESVAEVHLGFATKKKKDKKA